VGGRQRRPRCAAWRRTRCRMKPGMHCPAPGTAQARCCAPVGPPLCESESGAAQRAPAGRAGAGRRPLCSAQSAGSCSCPSRPASSAPRTASRWAASGPPAWSPPPGHRHHRLVTTAWSPPPPPGHHRLVTATTAWSPPPLLERRAARRAARLAGAQAGAQAGPRQLAVLHEAGPGAQHRDA